MMEYWNIGFLFHCSNIPLFHVAGIKKMPLKTFYVNKLCNFRDVFIIGYSRIAAEAAPT